MANEHIGYFEEFILLREGCSPKCLGVRAYPIELPKEQQGRELGVSGRRDFAITEPIELQKGHRTALHKASTTRPLKVMTMLQKLEGRHINGN